MAEADRIAAALRYQQELDAAQRPATMNPNIAAQGLKSRNRIAAALASQPQSWSGEALPMEGRAAFLPFQDTMPGSVMNTRSLALPGIVAGAVNAITAPGRALVDPEFNQGEEAANVALNVMGGGIGASRAAPAPAGSLGMNVVAKRAFTAPQDEALRLAQQRAALPVKQHGLGLPADNTPAQRAAAMAFENGFWHETSAKNAENLKSFSLNPSMAKAAASDELTPYAVFLKRHGKTINVAENPVQMPMAVNVGREFGFVDRPSLQDSLVSNGPNAKEIKTAIENTKFYDKKMASKFDEMFKRSDYDLDAGDKMLAQWELKNKENAAIAKQLITDRFNSPSNYGADTIRLLNDKGSMGRNVDTTMVMNPDNIRSRFAAFDPFRRNAALAAALGVAAPDLLAEEKK